ncbi:FAD-dependent monooxygenase [Ramlibacter aurantiacus]|uniref:FAD-dependent monooxygenase n=1 Tax=Ramlibacter aurantiacus TaxID=2801330 RepID=UPI00338DBBAF
MPLEVEVMVVGAGPAGLSMALELGLHGRRCLVIEGQARTGLAPRAKTTNVRTRELMRRWGMADRLAQLAPFGVDYPSDVVFASSMVGPELARFHNAMYCSPRRDDRFSEHAQWIPQYKVEQALRERALAFPGVSLSEPTRLVSFSQDGEGVLAQLQDGEGGRSWQVRARYLVGADGARSTVRELLGIRMDGTSPLGQHRNYIFHAPGLAGRTPLGPGVMYWLVNDRFPAVVAPLDAGDLWTFGCPRGAVSGDPADMIRSAMGLDIELEILTEDDWTAHELIARQYRQGRVFLVGDACHLHPPFGGHGMNMGIGDSVDLGWKLHATLAGWGGPRLLDSYEIERRQVHRRVVDESVSNHRHLSSSFYAPGLAAPGPQGDALRASTRERILASKRPEFDSLGIVIGYHYERSPVLLREVADEPERQPAAPYQPSARPGCRSPHAWLSAGRGEGASLFDHYDPSGMTLLATGARVTDEMRRLAADAAAAGIPLRCIAPEAAGLAELFGADYALIRPDHHVAWRGDDLDRAALALRVACGQAVQSPQSATQPA